MSGSAAQHGPDATADLRARLARAGEELQRCGLSRGTSGNISARIEGGMLITPSAVPYDRLEPDMLIPLSLDGAPLAAPAAARPRPSTEWRLHAAVLRARGDVAAVVHAHPPFATALACLRRALPPFHYMVAIAGGRDIPCAPYATFGTYALAHHAADVLRDRNACLLANHGIVAVGRSVERALALALEVETLAEMYCRAVQVGTPVLLSDAEMNEAIAAFAGYGAADE